MKIWIGTALKFQTYPVNSTPANSAKCIKIW